MITLKAYRKKNATRLRVHKKKDFQKQRVELSDIYIRNTIRKSGIEDPSQELIAVVRMRITLKRTLRELKKWRGHHESSHSNV